MEQLARITPDGQTPRDLAERAAAHGAAAVARHLPGGRAGGRRTEDLEKNSTQVPRKPKGGFTSGHQIPGITRNS